MRCAHFWSIVVERNASMVLDQPACNNESCTLQRYSLSDFPGSCLRRTSFPWRQEKKPRSDRHLHIRTNEQFTDQTYFLVKICPQIVREVLFCMFCSAANMLRRKCKIALSLGESNLVAKKHHIALVSCRPTRHKNETDPHRIKINSAKHFGGCKRPPDWSYIDVFKWRITFLCVPFRLAHVFNLMWIVYSDVDLISLFSGLV
jgi:hypothetical protein